MRLDAADLAILRALEENARLSIKELAARIGFSSPSTSERLRRLEERGVIRGYRAEIDPPALGLAIQALVRINPLPGRVPEVEKQVLGCAEIVECDKVTGEDCFVARLHVRSMDHLDQVVDAIAVHASTNTAIVKSQPIRRRSPL